MDPVFPTHSRVVGQVLTASPCQTIREWLVCEMSFSAVPLPQRAPKPDLAVPPSSLNEVAIFAAWTYVYL